MSLKGLPDFHQPLRGEDFSLYFPFEGNLGADAMLLTPNGLEIDSQPDGGPDFSIEFVTESGSKYGFLRFGVRPGYSSADIALTLARQTYSEATIRHTYFSGGYLRLWLFNNVSELDPEAAAELTQPQRLGWNELDKGKFTVRLSSRAIEYIKRVVLDGAITPFSAYAEMELVGVPPRFKVRASFDPAELLPDLIEDCKEGNCIVRRNRLIQRFNRELSSVPIELEGQGLANADKEELAESLVDRLRVRYGEFMPINKPSPEGDTCFRLPSPRDIVKGRVYWDLAEPFSAPRPVVIKLHPLEQAHLFAKEKGEKAVFKTRIPELETGVFTLRISVNVPPAITQIDAIGVDIFSPPSIHRRHKIRHTCELPGPVYNFSQILRFSPVETKQYKYRCYVVMKGGRMIESSAKWEDLPFYSDADLTISVADLPVNLMILKADEDLLRKANIAGNLTWHEESMEYRHEFSLRFPDLNGVTLVTPKQLTQHSQIVIEAGQLTGDKKLSLQLAQQSNNLRLGFYSFREWGQHHVEVKCLFPKSMEVVLVDFLPEGVSEKKAKTLTFNDTKPQQKWAWTADSMFNPGYRYRVRALEANTHSSEWLTPPSIFEPLIIDLTSLNDVSD